jgi:excisionase family DNA binding protein
MNDFLTVAEVADLCKVTPRTVLNWIKKGARGKKLQAEEFGHYRIRPEALRAFGSAKPTSEQHRQDRERALRVLRGAAEECRKFESEVNQLI